MTVKTVKTYHLQGKTDQRLILRALAESNDCEFYHNVDTSYSTIKGDLPNVEKTNHLFNCILMTCYLKMAIMQAQNSTESMVSVRATYMRAFTDFVVSRIVGHSLRVKNDIEFNNPVVEAAYEAAMEVEVG